MRVHFPVAALVLPIAFVIAALLHSLTNFQVNEVEPWLL
jgi:hypothetical protein